MAIAPPLPDWTAEVSTRAPCSIVTVFASCLLLAAASALALIPACVELFTCVPPETAVLARPTLTCPPPLAPVALVVELLAKVMSVPIRLTWPPWPVLLLAVTLPAWVTVLATNSIVPPLFTKLLAEILPVFLMTVAISWLAEPAAITTKPPLTSTTRLFSIKPW